jgi:hypothetical protein
MAYFIFSKNLNDVYGTLCFIVENENNLNNLNINKQDYHIIEVSGENFNSVKLGDKYIERYNGDTITYLDAIQNFDKNSLKNYIENYRKQIIDFLSLNKNHPDFNKWNSYLNQLLDFQWATFNYPLNKSLEKHFNDLGQPSLHPLQLP